MHVSVAMSDSLTVVTFYSYLKILCVYALLKHPLTSTGRISFASGATVTDCAQIVQTQYNTAEKHVRGSCGKGQSASITSPSPTTNKHTPHMHPVHTGTWIPHATWFMMTAAEATPPTSDQEQTQTLFGTDLIYFDSGSVASLSVTPRVCAM